MNEFNTGIYILHYKAMEDTDYRQALAEARKQAANKQPNEREEKSYVNGNCVW